MSRDFIQSMSAFVARDYERDYVSVTLCLKPEGEKFTFSFDALEASHLYNLSVTHYTFAEWLVHKAKIRLILMWRPQP